MYMLYAASPDPFLQTHEVVDTFNKTKLSPARKTELQIMSGKDKSEHNVSLLFAFVCLETWIVVSDGNKWGL